MIVWEPVHQEVSYNDICFHKEGQPTSTVICHHNCIASNLILSRHIPGRNHHEY